MRALAVADRALQQTKQPTERLNLQRVVARCRIYCGGHWVKRGGSDSENGKRWELRTKNIEDGPILCREEDRSQIGATSLVATRQTNLSVTHMTV